ncbi:MAG: mechanosensitive ion channel family protein [Bernardetiaceae bacterium]|jgi:small conductance mechanosensitive channel|nr:mechanosensitive ion channel family protein [Bernardetiaceae bacterium]
MEPIEKYLGKMTELGVTYAPKLLLALVVFVVGWWIVGGIAKAVGRALERNQMDVSLRTFLKSLVSIALKIMLVISVAGMVGIETTSFVAIFGAASLAVGLALQGSLGNFAGGVLLLIFRPFKVGDVIEAQGKAGEVKEIQIFCTILATPDGKTVIMPNGPLSNGIITNLTAMGRTAVEIKVELSDRHSIDMVRETLLPLMTTDPRVLKDPGPAVGIAQLKSGAMVVAIACFTAPADQLAVAGALTEKVKVALQQNHLGGPESHTFVHNVA